MHTSSIKAYRGTFVKRTEGLWVLLTSAVSHGGPTVVASRPDQATRPASLFGGPPPNSRPRTEARAGGVLANQRRGAKNGRHHGGGGGGTKYTTVNNRNTNTPLSLSVPLYVTLGTACKHRYDNDRA